MVDMTMKVIHITVPAEVAVTWYVFTTHYISSRLCQLHCLLPVAAVLQTGLP